MADGASFAVRATSDLKSLTQTTELIAEHGTFRNTRHWSLGSKIVEIFGGLKIWKFTVPISRGRERLGVSIPAFELAAWVSSG
jgi:hypothetical protein